MAQSAGKTRHQRMNGPGNKKPRKHTGTTSGKRRSNTTTHGKSSGKPASTGATVLLLNKPYGYISQFSGDNNTLADLVKIKHVYPAGRLDKDSEGLLILTNHGPLQHRISHPKMKWQKHYWVQVEGDITETALRQLCHGVTLKDGEARAVTATQIDPPSIWPRNPPVRYRASVADCWIDLTLNEGRNRQVRRMTAAVGFPTLRLIRHQIGPWDIADIESGKYQTIELSSAALQDLSV